MDEVFTGLSFPQSPNSTEIRCPPGSQWLEPMQFTD